jgi:hypothetical protein
MIDASATVRALASTPSSAASVFARTDELRVVLITVAASSAEPVMVKEIVAVVSVVIGDATEMDVVFSTLVSEDVRALVRAAVALASALRLSPPVGVMTITKVTTKLSSDRRRLADESISTSQPVLFPQKLLCTPARSSSSLWSPAAAPRSTARVERCWMTTSALSSSTPSEVASDALSMLALRLLVAAAPSETLVLALNASGAYGGGVGGGLGGGGLGGGRGGLEGGGDGGKGGEKIASKE